ncbi:hypothetical protein ACQE32_02500 [Pantoea sp. FN0302]|uniref:hypothetical protein n=1 Tax=unclassified Pantoea TaxID=2630326 RepID=UPI003CF809C7
MDTFIVSLWNLSFQQYLAFALLLMLLYRYTGAMVCLAVMVTGASLWRVCYGEALPALLLLLLIGSALGVLIFYAERYRSMRKANRFFVQ